VAGELEAARAVVVVRLGEPLERRAPLLVAREAQAAVGGRRRGQGVVLVAEDIGPPFQNLELALLDGNDDRWPIDPLDMLTRRGIGGGLGAIVRLSHSFQVEPLPVGKRVRVARYLRRLSKRPRAR
jgi:hypothetical protein